MWVLLLQNGSRTLHWQGHRLPAMLPPSRRPTGTLRPDQQSPARWDKNVSFFHMLAVICNIMWASNTPYWIPVVIICYSDSALCPPTDVLLLANPVYFLFASIFDTSLFSTAGTIFTVLPNFLLLPEFYSPNSQPGHAKYLVSFYIYFSFINVDFVCTRCKCVLKCCQLCCSHSVLWRQKVRQVKWFIHCCSSFHPYFLLTGEWKPDQGKKAWIIGF